MIAVGSYISATSCKGHVDQLSAQADVSQQALGKRDEETDAVRPELTSLHEALCLKIVVDKRQQEDLQSRDIEELTAERE
ncbi:unnamed protein product [Lampetra fluviatilis]